MAADAGKPIDGQLQVDSFMQGLSRTVRNAVKLGPGNRAWSAGQIVELLRAAESYEQRLKVKVESRRIELQITDPSKAKIDERRQEKKLAKQIAWEFHCSAAGQAEGWMTRVSSTGSSEYMTLITKLLERLRGDSAGAQEHAGAAGKCDGGIDCVHLTASKGTSTTPTPNLWHYQTYCTKRQGANAGGRASRSGASSCPLLTLTLTMQPCAALQQGRVILCCHLKPDKHEELAQSVAATCKGLEEDPLLALRTRADKQALQHTRAHMHTHTQLCRLSSTHPTTLCWCLHLHAFQVGALSSVAMRQTERTCRTTLLNPRGCKLQAKQLRQALSVRACVGGWVSVCVWVWV
eukprot:jgi/Chlat1/2172/Chrsp17S02852